MPYVSPYSCLFSENLLFRQGYQVVNVPPVIGRYSGLYRHLISGLVPLIYYAITAYCTQDIIYRKTIEQKYTELWKPNTVLERHLE